ncbi:hypothetical protein BD770DRAFT_202966 [Pilaira anomala]|nr:hypothetical protein BD770DRAFT_202966 [Pilaira anomala]
MLEKPSITFSEQMKVTANNFFRLDGVSLCDQPRDTVISFNTTKQHDGYQYNYYAFLQLNLNPKLVILKNGFGKDSKIQQALFNMPEGIITDMEFFDENELGICIQDDKNDSTLSTLLLNDIEFKTISDTKDLKVNRSLKLENMIHVKLGCNGSPKRRIMCVVASNGLLKVYSMDNDDDDDDDDDDEAEQDDDSEEE